MVLELMDEFDDITFFYLPRDENQMVDALATLASMIRVNKLEDMKPIQMSTSETLAHCYNIETSIKTSTGATPFSLVYRMKAVLPTEVEIPSLRVLAELKLDEAEWVQSRYDKLNLIEGKRLKAIQHGQMYQRRMMQVYNKKGEL
ncbi:uncharacterized protein [Gossypium hirsutum]|uniref:RNase H type-1 domain-containing protein n=1 Tax=Gossypium hirsutum TaxID=3635 RepID=A0A1U8MWZ2_GOSHI|nr:uncharacterized protein LOC107941097 [Gossypium hirsutum]